MPVLAAVLLGVAVLAAIGLRPRAAAPQPVASTTTAAVVRTDLTETHTVDGEIGFGPATPLPSALSGVVTAVPAAGSTVGRGGRLYSLDARPVILFVGGLPAYRELRSGLRGRDVRQLEQNLAALGYRGFQVDDRFTAATTRAVRRWQDDRGLVETGAIELGRVLFWPGPIRVAAVDAVPGQSIAGGSVVLSHTSTNRSVYADVDVELSEFARRGAAVRVQVPGRAAVSGVISAVGTTIQAGEPASEDSTTATQEPTIGVTVAISNQSGLGVISGAPVEVQLTGSRRAGVLAVPVAALLALREGGYGLEIVTGSTRRVVAVRTGLFAAGLVEVAGAGVTAGTVVGMAAG